MEKPGKPREPSAQQRGECPFPLYTREQQKKEGAMQEEGTAGHGEELNAA
jgi:hypothetical protein